MDTLSEQFWPVQGTMFCHSVRIPCIHKCLGPFLSPSITPLYSPHLSFFATGLSTRQPNHPGPGDPDRAFSACDRPAPRGGGLPVLPQCLSTALLPLQGPPGPIRDPSRQRLLPPEGLHRKHHEVWISSTSRLRFLYLGCLTSQKELNFTFNRKQIL